MIVTFLQGTFEFITTLVNLHCCIQRIAVSLVVYTLNDSKVHTCSATGASSLCLMFGIEFCYHYMYSDIYYCFVSDLLSVSLVTQELTSVGEKWEYIGEELGVEQSSLRYIHTKYSKPGDCLTEMLFERLKRCLITTWGDVIAVLRSSHVGEFHLADYLEAKYYPSELTQ